jgi:hypothetical protein
VDPDISGESQISAAQSPETPSVHSGGATAVSAPAVAATDPDWPRRKRELEAVLAALDGR